MLLVRVDSVDCTTGSLRMSIKPLNIWGWDNMRLMVDSSDEMLSAAADDDDGFATTDDIFFYVMKIDVG